jgi:amino acid transporter
MNAVHANDVDKPQRSYPIAILASVLMIVLFTSLGTLAIAMVIPKNEISLTAGSVAAIDHFLSAYGLGKLIPTICVLISFGALAALSTWIIGPSTGLLTAAKSGDLPPMLRTVTKSGTPLGMLLLQGFIVSLLSLVFFVMPSVSSSFWMMTAMTSQLYLMMYLLLFISALVLKFRQPDVHRTFKVPGGKVGMSLVCFLGIVSSIFCFVVGFFPPSQLDMGGVVRYEIIQFSGVFAFFIAPFIILALKKPHWETKE